MRVLISGAGPAGLTLAACLVRQGIAPVIVERNPRPATEGGYAVGIHVNGWNVAERLGLIDALKSKSLSLGRSEYRTRTGRTLFSYDYSHLAAASGGKMLAIMRDALQTVLLDDLGDGIDLRYGVTVTSLVEAQDQVEVGFSNGLTENFDLVVGADGYRSNIRALWFGPPEDFLRPLGYRAAAWRIPTRAPMPCSFTGFMDVDRQGGLYDVGDGTCATLFCWRDDVSARVPVEARKAILEKMFGDFPAQISDTVRSEVDWAAGFFDTIYQVEVENWHRGRVVLLGDAAHCMTFLSGQGTSTAMAGAYILAKEISSKPLPEALSRYEHRLKPSTAKLQHQSQKIGGHYVPRSRLGMHIQSLIIPLMTRPPFASVFAKRMLARSLDLN